MDVTDIAEQVIAGLAVLIIWSLVTRYALFRSTHKEIAEVDVKANRSWKRRLAKRLLNFFAHPIVSRILNLYSIVVPYGFLVWAFLAPPGSVRTFRLVMGAFMVGWQWGNFFIIVTEKWAEKRLKALADEAFEQANQLRADAEDLLVSVDQRTIDQNALSRKVEQGITKAKKLKEDAERELAEAQKYRKAAAQDMSEAQVLRDEAAQTLAEAHDVHNRAEALIKRLEQEKGATEQRLEKAQREESDSKTEQLQQRIAYLEGQIDILKSLRED